MNLDPNIGLDGDMPAAVAAKSPVLPVPREGAIDARQAAIERKKRQTPEELVLARRERLLQPYRRAMAGAEAQLGRYGFLERLRDPEGYEKARSRMEFVRSANEKAERVLDEQEGQVLEALRRKLVGGDVLSPQPSPAGSAIELDPRHQRAPISLGQ